MTYRTLPQHEEEGRVSRAWDLEDRHPRVVFFAPHLFKIKYKTDKEPTNAYRRRPRRVQFSLANGHTGRGRQGSLARQKTDNPHFKSITCHRAKWQPHSLMPRGSTRSLGFHPRVSDSVPTPFQDDVKQEPKFYSH